MEYFVIPCRPPVFPSYFLCRFLFLHGEALAAAAEGPNKPAKIIKIQANDETLAAKRP